MRVLHQLDDMVYAGAIQPLVNLFPERRPIVLARWPLAASFACFLVRAAWMFSVAKVGSLEVASALMSVGAYASLSQMASLDVRSHGRSIGRVFLPCVLLRLWMLLLTAFMVGGEIVTPSVTSWSLLMAMIALMTLTLYVRDADTPPPRKRRVARQRLGARLGPQLRPAAA